MIARLRAMFHRYASAHLRLSAATQPIHNTAGEVIGYLEAAEVAKGQISVQGWVEAESVSLVLAGQREEAAPTLWREDVAKARGGSAAVGFSLSLPCYYETIINSAPPGLEVFDATGKVGPSLSLPFSRQALSREKVRLLVTFLGDGVRAAPPILGWATTHNPMFRARAKRAFRLDLSDSTGKLDSGLFDEDETSTENAMPTIVTIILPIHNAFDLIGEALNRIVRNTDTDWRLILIDDASTDPRVKPFLRNWTREQLEKRQGRIDLLENESNEGFVGSVNAGLQRALARPDDDGPVILLNSDAFVPAGWASRLVKPLMDDPSVASVTPMSNDSEITSVPSICTAIDLQNGQVDAIDATARTFNPTVTRKTVPTGVGFCMALSREWLKHEPRFDTTFGRGYGEEVDWCQKIRARGGQHLATSHLFVGHVGGKSFGTEEKAARIARNNAIISARYPDYDREIQTFIKADPLRTARLALGLAWAGSLPNVRIPIYLSHSMGGGAQKYIESRIVRDQELNIPSVVLRVGGKRRWQVELSSWNGRLMGMTDSTELVLRLLQPIVRRHIVYSCGVGDPRPLELPAFMCSLKRSDTDSIEMLFHDYFALSPSYTLLDSDGVYRGSPPSMTNTDKAHVFKPTPGVEISLQEWRDTWHILARRANEIHVFSHDSAAHVTDVWPDLSDKIHVRPHKLFAKIPKVPAPITAPRKMIGVLGNIGYQKGAKLLQDLARTLPSDGDTGLVLIGNIDPSYPLPAPARVLGSYDVKQIAVLARAENITHWLIPSIWPETFSYTTHEALATGLPVLAFNIGAQGEAVRAAPNGHALSFHADGDMVASILNAIRTIRADI